MTAFDTRTISPEPDGAAPDGADVRVLLRLAGGSMPHFELAPGEGEAYPVRGKRTPTR